MRSFVATLLFPLLTFLPSPVFALELAVKVVRVIDGDTLKVEVEGHNESVRLIGIDTPESKANAKALKDSGRSGEELAGIVLQGKKATTFTRSLVRKGDVVHLETDVQQRDKYRRILAYVYLRDGSMLNEAIVRAGYASLMTIPPNVKHQERFVKAFRDARENHRGLWE